MRVVVFGAGATGSLFGARLALGGHAVLLVGRSAHVEAIRRAGLVVDGGPTAPVRLEAEEELPEGTRADALLLTVKTYDAEPAARAIAERLAARAPVLALQNGLGVEALVERGLTRGGWSDAASWIVRGVHSVPATLLAPGRIRAAGQGEVLLGPGEGGRGAAHVEPLRTLFASGGFPVRVVPRIEVEVWRKLLVNAAVNPVTADHGVVNGSLLKDPWRGQALRLLSEALSVAREEGFEFSREEAEHELFRVVRATAENRSSMLQDLERGRPTEIDAIAGELVRLGGLHGLTLPATERALRRIRARAATHPRASSLRDGGSVAPG